MKRAILWTIGTAICVFGVCGCSSLDYVQGTKVTDDKVASFTKGKTTRDEVVAALGGPQDIKLEGGKQILIYKYQRIGALVPGRNEGSDTMFIFDANGILEDTLRSQGSSLPNPLTGR